MVLQNFFDVPADVAAFYTRDDSGIGSAPLPGSNVQAHHRVNHLRFAAAQKYLYGTHLNQMTIRFLKHLGEQIQKDEWVTNVWQDHPNLTDFLQTRIFRAATTSLCGPHFFRLNPTFTEDFWTYIGDLPVLYKGLPRWLNPKAHQARDRCIAAIIKWHKHAWENLDHSNDNDDLAWEPYFGARIMRVRYTNFRKMEATTDKSRAAEDLAMIFAYILSPLLHPFHLHHRHHYHSAATYHTLAHRLLIY